MVRIPQQERDGRRVDENGVVRGAKLARAIGRRDFVRTSGGILVAAALVSGCKDGLLASARGRVRVQITGLGAGVTSAGSATITGSAIDTPIQVLLPPLEEAEIEVPVGAYTVTYAPPAGYAIAQGEFNTSDVNVVEGELSSVAFAVVAATGVLRIGAAGLTGGALGGGDVQVLRIDIGGQSPTNVILPVVGTVDTGLLPGLYRLTYTPPGGHQLVAGQENPRQVAVDGSVLASTTFTVEAQVAAAGVIFSSDWSTSLGSSVNAQRDGIVGGSPAPKWSFMGGSSQCEVISAAGLDFPTTHCLRIPFSPAAFSLLRVDTLPIIAVGTRRTYRWYYRCAMPASDARIPDWNFHPMQDGFAGGDCNWVFQTYTNFGPEWQPQLWAGNGTQPYPYNNWIGPRLAKGVTYRFEVQFFRNTATTFRLSIRIFNSANVEIANNSHFSNGVSHTLASIAGAVPGTTDFVFNDLANTNGFNAGTNDTYSLSPADPRVIMGYEGAVAIADNTPDGWIGPYAGGV